MKKLHMAILAIISLCILMAVTGFTANNQQSKADEKIKNTVQVSKMEQTKDGSINTISYQLDPTMPILNITSQQLANVDIDALKKEIGEDNVGVDLENQQLHLNLKDKIDESGKGSFDLIVNVKDKIMIGFTDIQENELLITMLNPDGPDPNANDINVTNPNDHADPDGENDKPGEDSDDGVGEDPNIYENEDDPTKGWTRTEKMMISPGHVIKNPDGSKTYPVIYFGAINYALQGITIRDAVAGRPLTTGLLGLLGKKPIGEGRKNNVTAANTSIIEVPKNGSMNDLQTNRYKKTNHYSTNTFGDGMLPPAGFGSNLISTGQKSYRGSQRNFATTNLYNYYKNPAKASIPKVFGPDEKNNGKYTGLVKKQTRLYFKLYKDPESDEPTIMQRLIFYQKVRDYQVRIKITQRFDKNNGVIVNYEFFNVGTKQIDSFQGYVFRDITFMKDHNIDSSKQMNVIRSLGEHQGIYATSKEYGQRFEMKFDGFDDEPYAWSSSGTRSTYFAASKKDHFPWNYNGPIKKQDAFKDINDLGDKAIEPGRGNSWVDENISYDSGVSMHTKDQALLPGDKVTMSYAVNALEVKLEPELEIYNASKKEKPHELDPEANSFKVDGEWRSAHNRYVKIKYLVRSAEDSIDDEKDKKDVLKNGTILGNDYKAQTDSDKNGGVPQKWSTEIKLDQLQSGVNEMVAVAIDKEGRTSGVKRTYINLPERDYPIFIQINSPMGGTTRNTPYEPRVDKNFTDKIDISGMSFSPSGIYKIHYFVDDDPIGKTFDVGDGSEANEPHQWKLPDFSLKPYMKDTNTHSMRFVIYSTEKDSKGNEIVKAAEDAFHFRMKPKKFEKGGYFQIIPPEKIDFGTLNMAANSEKDTKAKIEGNLFVDDYREPDHKENPVHVTLSHDAFVKESGEILQTDLRWNKYQVDPTRSYDIKSDDMTNRKVLTDVLKDNLHLKVKRQQTTRDGTFKSIFHWSATDSL